jgi:uncharacterized membrane protein YjdF
MRYFSRSSKESASAKPSAVASIRRHPVIAGVFAAYWLGFVTLGVAVGSRLTVPYAVLVLAAACLVVVMSLRVNFSSAVLGGLAFWAFLHMAGGIVPVGGGRVLYNLWLVDRVFRYDHLVHVIGFGTGTIACWEALRPRLNPEVEITAGVAIVVALAGMGVGAINEVVEFVVDLILEETNVGGYANTGGDLIANTLGCSLAAVIVYRRELNP